jgi:hypothetical protein
MTDGLQISRRFFMTLAAMSMVSSALFGKEPKSDDAFSLQFWADATVFSLQPGEELATYRSYSGGGVGPNGTLGIGVADRQRQFDVSIVAKLKSGRFLAAVTVKPTDEDTLTQGQELDYDLTDLTPRTLEIARDENGRVYRLSLVPRILEKPKPRQFSASDLRLEYWSFPSSPLILNDQDYIGRLAMSSGPIAWCDIPGLAKIEFSLLHLKDASAIGSLEKGVIHIAHESGTTLRISDVQNGANQEALGGGPYKVWVRWNKPTQSVEEYQESMKVYVASLKERVKNGELSLSPGSLKRLVEMSESGRIGLIGNGVRGVEDDDLAEPAE